MEEKALIDLIGYLGTILVVSAFLSKNIFTIRALSIAGSVLFLATGIMLGTTSIVTLNILLIAINFYQIIKLKNKKLCQ